MNRDTRAAIPADGRPQQNNALRQMAVAIQHIHSTTERIQKGEEITNMSRNKAKNCRNEVKSYITREGMTMTEVVELLADEHGWSSSVPNLSGKLRRGSLRYTEAVELADVLGYDLVWQKRREVR